MQLTPNENSVLEAARGSSTRMASSKEIDSGKSWQVPKLSGPVRNKLEHSDSRERKLLEILAEYNLVLPRNAIEWRVPAEPQSGYIKGITMCSISLLLTDGIVGWFAYDNGTILFGHMQHFEKDKETKERIAKAGGGPRKHKKKPLNPNIQKDIDED